MNETRTWFYADGEQTVGPVDAAEIGHLIRKSAIEPSTWMLAEGTDDWVLAQDSPFAAHLGNVSSQQVPPDQTTVDSAPPLARPNALPSVEGEQPHETLSAKFSQLGSAVLSETKRSARLASIKAIIEKLKHVDLTKAHYALGKKAYELKIDQDYFSDQYREVSTLEETIKAKKAGNGPDEGATIMENFRGAAINLKSSVEAEAFEIKRKQWLTKIGKEYWSASVPTALIAEFEAVARIDAQIEERESEYASVSADRTPLLRLCYLARTVFKMAIRQVTPAGNTGNQIHDTGVWMKHKIINDLRPRFTPIRKTRLIVLVVILLLSCFVVGRFVHKRHYHAVENPEQQFQQFQTMAAGLGGSANETVGHLTSGMTMPETLAALNTVEITNSSPYASAYQTLLEQYSYDRKLETGDNLKSLLLRIPEDMPSEISCMAVSFFNGGLFRVIYIYNQQEIETIVPKQQRYAGDGDKWRVEELKDRWDVLVNRTVAAAAQKYTPVTLKFVNFFDASRSPEMLSLHRDDAETVLFHGASKSAVAHIAYLTQGKTNIGLLDPNSTITTFYEQRVIVATFLFLDFAREHALSYYRTKVKVLQKQDEEERSRESNGRQKMIDQDAREHLRAAEEEKRKQEQLGKNF